MKYTGVIIVSALLLLSPILAQASAHDQDKKDSDRDINSFTEKQLKVQLHEVCIKLQDVDRHNKHFRLPPFCDRITPPPLVPTVSISASPSSAVPGATTTLTWQSANAVRCDALSGWSGQKPLAGSEVVTFSATTTYALSCGNGSSTTTADVTVNIVPPIQPPVIPRPANDFLGPLITSLSITPTSTQPGGIITFSASAQD